jgi:hypothetical protein
MELRDWPRAMKSIQIALESTEALYGRQDKRYSDLMTMLNKVSEYRESAIRI